MNSKTWALLIVSILAVWCVLLLSPLGLAGLNILLDADTSIAVETARLVYSWPVAVTLIAFAFMARFHSSIAQLIARIIRIKPGEIAFAEPPPQTTVSVDELIRTTNEIMSEKGEGQTEPGQEAALWRTRAEEMRENWHFEWTWARIYSTQLNLVEFLEFNPALQMSAVRLAFDDHKRRLAAAVMQPATMSTYSPLYSQLTLDAEAYYAGYVGFLLSARLVSIDATTQTLLQTDLTKKFLDYGRTWGYSKSSRPL